MAVRKLIGLALLASVVWAGSAAAQAPAQTPAKTPTPAQSPAPAQTPDKAPAEEDTTPVWTAHVEGDAAAISFSVPDSDDTRFMVLCENQKRAISLTVYEEVKGMKVKQPLTIDLSAGDQKASIKGRTTTDELNGFVFGEAVKVPPGPLLAVLRAPGDLTVKLGKETVTFPAGSRAEHLKTFEKGCKAK